MVRSDTEAISKWDPRTREVLKKYGLANGRLSEWERTYGRPEYTEYAYLLHTANVIFQLGFRDRKASIPRLREARGIYELLNELGYKNELVSRRIKLCDSNINAEKVKS